MPADFLTKAADHHLRATLTVFGENTLRPGGLYIWFAAASADNTDPDLAFVVPVPCATSTPRRRANALTGEIYTPVDEIIVHLRADDLPWSPLVPEQTQFLIARAIAGQSAADPDAGRGFVPDTAGPDAKRYLLKSCSAPSDSTPGLRLTGVIHGTS